MRIVGATVINNASEVALLTVIIKGRVDIAGVKNRFADIGFNLAEVVNS